MTDIPDDLIGANEVIGAITAVLHRAPTEDRSLVYRTLEAWAECFPDDYFWAFGPQAPGLLSDLLMAIYDGCSPEDDPEMKKGRPSLRLVKPRKDGEA